ncbi:uncharacterized protein LOC113309562 isoform X2 [Papaver somniferum]|uniref:uncharacterized protein LOC113309562 isoform X2 n=1 Tax=Papaver somniferum TaxID=3469 RepID=UPI000E6FBCE0|nr:uncharacterized protein LOC113309562 isoform X2 [Papaver somniferum]
MTTAMKAGSFQISSIYYATSTIVKAAFFHSTSVSNRKRRTSWGFRSKNYTKRLGKMHAEETLLRNASAFAECLFQSWRDDDDSQPSSSEGNSWFKRYWPKEPKKNSTGSQGSRWETYRGRRGVFQFCDVSDKEVETKFRSAFHRSFQNTRYRFEDDYETYEDFNDSSNSSASDLASDRLALGLSASGPLKLEDVKNAYRSCALRWHPDRHQCCSKDLAEEKFKLCSAAYQSLCDKLN